ncbi:MAG: transglutaminase-like domain-containing protein [Ignavibacteriota bacterium]
MKSTESEIPGTPDGEFNSLLSLLDDPDDRIASAVEERLRQRGPLVLNPLLDFIDLSADDLAKRRATVLAKEFNETILLDEFTALRRKIDQKKRGALEEGAFLVARHAYPRLDKDFYSAELDALSGMLLDRIKGIMAPSEVLRAMNEFFFREKGFRGNHDNFHDPDNSYINQVLDRRIGIPISLSVIYVLVAGHRLGLPISGVSTPGHFLIRYDGICEEPLFVDAYNNGTILREKDIKKFLYSSGLPYYESFIRPASARMILLRMIRNLIVLYRDSKDTDSQTSFEKFQSALLGRKHNQEQDPAGDIFE